MSTWKPPGSRWALGSSGPVESTECPEIQSLSTARVCWICPRPLSSIACCGTQLHLRERQTWATGLHIHLAKWGTPWGTFWTPTWKPVAWQFDTFGWVCPHDFLRSFRYLSSPFFPLGLFPILTSMEGIHSLDALVGDFLGRDGSIF